MIKATRKYIKKLYGKVFQCGYCDLQDIMRGISPTYYNCGVYGWNFDCYTNGDIAITTGYRNMTGKRIPREIIDKYSKIADEIYEYYRLDGNYETREERYRTNRENFFAELAKM